MRQIMNFSNITPTETNIIFWIAILSIFIFVYLCITRFWSAAYDLGYKKAMEENKLKDIGPKLTYGQIERLTKEEILLHQTDPECNFGTTRYEHDVMGFCPCI